MAVVFISELAAEDRIQIQRYLMEKGGISVANHYRVTFDKLFAQLSRFPESGATRGQMGPRTYASELHLRTFFFMNMIKQQMQLLFCACYMETGM